MLQNYAERQSEDRLGAALGRMADQAVASMLAAALAVEEGTVPAAASTGHTGKNLAVETGVDGTLVAAAVWVDAHEKTVKEDQALILVLVISLFQERWNSKVGSQTTQEVPSMAKKMDDVDSFVVDLDQRIPLNTQRFVVWEQTRTEQGNWPTKTLTSLWKLDESWYND